VYRIGNARKMRVTTIRRDFAQEMNSLAIGFDQEAATVALARLAVYKSMVEEHPNVGQWLDKNLFKFTSHFANYTRGDIQSFSLPPQMKSFPQFMYHLRRTNLINPFGCSPDEVLRSSANSVLLLPTLSLPRERPELHINDSTGITAILTRSYDTLACYAR
jgi:hypothetical protein